MSGTQTFTLKRYRTQTFLKTLFGLILLGTLGVLGLQQVATVPAWVQYLVLTGVIAAAFFTASNLCATPVQVEMDALGIIIFEGERTTRTLPWAEIEDYAFYQELLLYSLKITIQSQETLSLICFKWEDPIGFRSFLEQFENWLETVSSSSADGTVSGSGTFYTSRLKVILTAFLLVVYIYVAVVLASKNAFAAWNPVWIYYFWVVPVAFFIKMWVAR